MYSWNLLPSFLQAVFSLNYTYVIQRITELSLYQTEENFEIQQFEVDALVNVSTAESIKI